MAGKSDLVNSDSWFPKREIWGICFILAEYGPDFLIFPPALKNSAVYSVFLKKMFGIIVFCCKNHMK